MRKLLCAGFVLSAVVLQTGRVAAQEVTHLGIPSNRIVNLVGVPGDTCGDNNGDGTGPYELRRLKGTGALEGETFVVPTGMRLIITDVNWTVRRAPSEGFLAGENVTLILYPLAFGIGPEFGPVFTSTGVRILADTTDLISGTDHLVSGAVVAPGRQLCAYSRGLHQAVDASPDSFSIRDHSPLEVHVTGYLVKI